MKTNISIQPQSWHNKYKGIAERRSMLLRFRRECFKMKKTTPNADIGKLEVFMQAVTLDRDIDAYEVIFKYFAPRVKSYMLRLTTDEQLAEELMQETMITVWHKADRFDPLKGALSTWIFTIARNLRIDAVRREKRPEFDPDDPAFVPDETIPADALIIMQQSSNELQQAMEKLPKEQFELIKMSFYDNHSQSAIAEKMNIPLGTVKSRMRLAFEKLRLSLKHLGRAS